ncbi:MULTISPECIES: MFS transporter [unclassified Microbacterium]|uniref:MFS transporter n=1 Tax=unclassified Microbacterium TaxID=2609290 RepID=UPI00214C8B1A|nr:MULTISPECIES: MFS transporter [unclassified Microbacterium]MCR2809186.1 MFS transporter [Microbacterium sp. zg.B185]WIM20335.1 MFS transporter [Microbacterium sp. zg-B185]
MSPTPAARARRGIPWFIVAGLLVAALSLRGPIVAPTPVLRDIEADFGIGSATAGLLTTAPVLMFALLTPIAALVIRRSGAEPALMLSLGGVLLGTVIRALPGYGWMLAGMFVIGAAVTIGNIVIPVIIRRDVPPAHVGVITAAYVAMLNAGSLVTSLLTAPLAAVIGWPAALLSWVLLTIAGIALWGAHLSRSRRSGDGHEDRYSGRELPSEGAAPAARDIDSTTITGPLPVAARGRQERTILRRPVTWLLLAAFAAQTTIYYSLSTWLPTLTADELGLDQTAAGALASVFQGAAIAGAFVVPLLARFTPAIVPTLTICASWLILTGGMLLAPQLTWLWLIVGAIAHAGGFVVIFTALVTVARSDREAAGMSALVQGGGYAFGAVGAPVMGALHEWTGGWTLPLAVLLVLAVLYCVALLAAGRAARTSRR